MQSCPDFVSWRSIILFGIEHGVEFGAAIQRTRGWDQSDKRDRGWRGGSFVRFCRDNRTRFAETSPATGLNGDGQAGASCIFDRINSRINDRVFWCFNNFRRRFPLISSAVAVRGRTLILWRCVGATGSNQRFLVYLKHGDRA